MTIAPTDPSGGATTRPPAPAADPTLGLEPVGLAPGPEPHAAGRYALISPCRDEADYVRTTLDTVAAQTRPPDLWVVVDDGSTDGTSEILAEYAEKLPYLKIVGRPNRGERSVGPGVIEAFYAGLEHVDLGGFEFVCKLDVDLELGPRYFERLMELMDADERLGTASGKPYFDPGTANGGPPEGRLVSEKCGDEASVGMTKFYRVSCFREIGGFERRVMWDGIDCHRCRMLGWRARSVDEPDLRFVHLRAMGSSHKGILTGRVRHGAGQHAMGTGPVYMAASAAFRMTRPPLVMGGLAMLWGYAGSAFSGRPRHPDASFRRFLNAWQWKALVKGKARALRELDEASRPRWAERVRRLSSPA